MSGEENKAIVSRFFDELWNQRRIETADEIIAPDCITHQLQSGANEAGVLRNPEAVKHHVSGWLVGFPDLRFDIEQMLAEDDHVVSRCVMHATHSGGWFGISPTGKRVSIRMIVTHRIQEGKIAEDWVLVESLGFFQQLGLISSTQELLALSAKQKRNLSSR